MRSRPRPRAPFAWRISCSRTARTSARARAPATPPPARPVGRTCSDRTPSPPATSTQTCTMLHLRLPRTQPRRGRRRRGCSPRYPSARLGRCTAAGCPCRSVGPASAAAWPAPTRSPRRRDLPVCWRLAAGVSGRLVVGRAAPRVPRRGAPRRGSARVGWTRRNPWGRVTRRTRAGRRSRRPSPTPPGRPFRPLPHLHLHDRRASLRTTRGRRDALGGSPRDVLAAGMRVLGRHARGARSPLDAAMRPRPSSARVRRRVISVRR